MNAPAKFALDELDVFLPGIDPAERAKRAKLRSIRNAATALIASTESSTARGLAWFAVEYATEALFAPAAADALDDLNKFGTRLMLTALQAEMIDTFGAGQ